MGVQKGGIASPSETGRSGLGRAPQHGHFLWKMRTIRVGEGVVVVDEEEDVDSRGEGVVGVVVEGEVEEIRKGKRSRCSD